MGTLLTILIIIIAILLTLIVLVQNSKGGGLAAGFQSSNQIMGVRKTTDMLEKGTWVLAGLLIVLSILSVGIQSSGKSTQATSEINQEKAAEQNNQTQKAVKAPNFGEAPVQQQAPAQQKQEAQPEKK